MVGLYEALGSGGTGIPRGVDDLRTELSGTAPLVVAKDMAEHVWKRAGLSYECWPGHLSSASVQLTAEWLAGLAVKFVLTATGDIDDRTPQRLWRSASSLGIPAYAFVDHPANIQARFEDQDGPVIPTRIYVIDEDMRAAVMRLGISRAQTAVVGNLHIWRLRRLARGVAADQLTTLRRIWGASDGRSVVLFASENIRELRPLGKVAPYDEFECLNRLRTMLSNKEATLSGTSLREPMLAIRPHPKDRSGKYSAFVGAGPPETIIDTSDDSMTAVLAADVVAGMTSNLMVEAAALGRATVCLAETRILK